MPGCRYTLLAVVFGCLVGVGLRYVLVWSGLIDGNQGQWSIPASFGVGGYVVGRVGWKTASEWFTEW